jgi:hypothetical protein
MSNYFRIKDLPGFEGLVAKSEDSVGDFTYLSIDALFDTSDNSTVDLPHEALCISAKYLEQVSFFDFASLQPSERQFGEYLYEGTFVKDTLNIVYSMYEKAVAITIFEMHDKTQKTLYTQNFFTSKELAMELIEDIMRDRLDSDDLIFTLKDLKDNELKGQS